MTIDAGNTALADELRSRTSAFVNHHVDLWVAVEGPGTLVLAGDDQTAVFRAATDWLADDPSYSVVDVRWERRSATPALTLRLVLQRGGTTAVPAPVGPKD